METNLDQAMLHFAQGRPAEALRLALLARGESPRDARASELAAAASHALDRPEDGMRWFREAVALNPANPEFACGLAACQFDLKLLKAARATLDAVLRLHPTHLQAWRNLAFACEADGDPVAAISALERAASLAPADVSILHDRAALALRTDRALEALRLVESALAGTGESAQTLHLLLESALKSGHPDTAVAAATQLLAQDAGDPFARRGLAAGLAMRGELDRASVEAGRVPEAMRASFDPRLIFLYAGTAALRACDWRRRPAGLAGAAARARDPALSLDVSEAPFHALAAGLDPRLCEALFTAHVRDLQARERPLAWPRPRRAARQRLRIGYVGTGFGEHPSGMALNPLLRAHDRGRFEVFAYALTDDDGSAWRAEAAASVDVFRRVAHMSATECAGLILTDDIDVLVDFSGLLEHGRPALHTHHPARVHLLLFETPALLSLPGIDSTIGDAVVLDAADPGARVPHCFLPLDPRWASSARDASAPPRHAHGLPEDAPVLCCFNTAYKIEPTVFGAWMRILERSPRAVLWLRDDGTAVRENLVRETIEAGVDPARLVFAGRLPFAEHLKRYRLADVFLDTFHYGAHVTAMQALAAGLPLLTIRGDRFSARVGASALVHAGLADLVAADIDDYIERALQFCQRSAIAADWRRRTQAAFAPEAATPRFAAYVQALENLYLQAFEQAGRRV